MNLISKFFLLILLMLYLLLGLSYSQKQGFWHDEMYTLSFLKGVSIYNFEGSIWSEKDTIYDVNHFKTLLAEDNFYSNFSKQILHEGHPPLYFVLLKFWSYIFGYSEVALRSFSLCCGLISLLVLFTLFRKKAKQTYTAWLVLVMLIFNPFLFYFFSEARMYALAFLLASLTFRYWMVYQEEKKIKSFAFLFFCLSSIGLLYTHYYGLFFLTTLAWVELLKFGFKRSLLNHGIAFLCLLPWVPAVRKQMSFHDVHWTDGIISFSASIKGYIEGINKLLISPIENLFPYEKVMMILILTILLVFLFIKEREFTLILLSAILIYGLQVYVFDQLVGHHTILVPRYYMFCLIFIYWGFYKLIDSSYKVVSSLVPLSYSIITGIVLCQIYQLDRAPKQMFREVAGFVDSQVDSNTRILVFEPEGVLMVGVAYYLQNNFKLVSAHKTTVELTSSAVFIDEMLGVEYCENKYHLKQKRKLEFIPFVAVNLYK
ncbi:MAG: hypothetical protein CFE21_07080 [Bacteroidetes bacterium B1(2017)]|nr:MAG: hypothetical protein CFE21_07080 [Bacteroidetes bacterium B1(2017)]